MKVALLDEYCTVKLGVRINKMLACCGKTSRGMKLAKVFQNVQYVIVVHGMDFLVFECTEQEKARFRRCFACQSFAAHESASTMSHSGLSIVTRQHTARF